MKTWEKRLIGISVVPITWGIFVDLRFGRIDLFIARVVIVTALGLLLNYVFIKIRKRIEA